jgi:clan AA aspartic protease (TIGR02281 family)
MKQVILFVLLLANSIAAVGDSIPLRLEGGTFVVPVLINDKITLDFTIDSGAADVSMPADVFSTMVRAGTVERGDLMDTQVYQLADGTKQSSQRFRIRSLRIGSLELRNVVGSVAPKEGTLLLGQSFLTRLKSWSIDNQRQVLVFNESPTPDEGTLGSHSGKDPDSSKWVLLGRSSIAGLTTGAEYVDVSSIKVVGNIRRAWFKRVSPRSNSAGKNPHEVVDYTLTRYGFNCEDESYRMEALTTRYVDGWSDSVPIGSKPFPWQVAAPDSLAGAMMKFVCEWKQ